MSATEIISELPKLSERELRAIRHKLTELTARDAGISICNQSALEGALLLDQMEEEDERRKTG